MTQRPIHRRIAEMTLKEAVLCCPEIYISDVKINTPEELEEALNKMEEKDYEENRHTSSIKHGDIKA